MERFIYDLYNDDILSKAFDLFDIRPESVEILDGYENFVYSAERTGQDCIIRIGHSSHRSVEQVAGELEFISHLKDEDISVSEPLHSVNQRYAEPIDCDDGYFTACLFRKAEGGHLPRKERVPDNIVYEWGRLIGGAHKATVELREQPIKRMHWHDEYGMWEKYLDLVPSAVKDVYTDSVQKVRNIPDRHYGLIHADAHAGNFFVQDGRITLFDFDDCVYSHFMNDIAIVLYYACARDEEGLADEDRFMGFTDCFLKGYSEEYHIEPDHFEDVNTFLALRDVFLHMIFKATIDPKEQSWVKDFLENSHKRAQNHTVFMDKEKIMPIAEKYF